MRITDSVAAAVANAHLGRTGSDAGGRRREREREEILLTLRAKKNHAKESDETVGRTATLPSAAGGSRMARDANWNIDSQT